MKKKYFTPTIAVLEIGASPILAGSDPTQSTNVINDSSDSNVKFNKFQMSDGSHEEMRSPERIYFDNWD